MRGASTLAGIAIVLAFCPALSGPTVNASAAARLRAPADVRLVVPPAVEWTEAFEDPELPLTVADTTTGHYGLAGAVIGGAFGTLIVGAGLAGYTDNTVGAYLYGAAIGGLPGFVIGGLIGSNIEKSPGDRQEVEEVAPPDTAGAVRH